MQIVTPVMPWIGLILQRIAEIENEYYLALNEGTCSDCTSELHYGVKKWVYKVQLNCTLSEQRKKEKDLN